MQLPDNHATRSMAAEFERQDAKWGEQNHPDGTGLEGDDFNAEQMKYICQSAFANGEGTWRHVLDEEVAEAYAETHPELLRAELVQVAAVALRWVEAIDRRASTHG